MYRKEMYILKENLVIENQSEFAEEMGIAPETLSRILSGKQKCSKVIAYSIAKHYNKNRDIKNYFERVD